MNIINTLIDILDVKRLPPHAYYVLNKSSYMCKRCLGEQVGYIASAFISYHIRRCSSCARVLRFRTVLFQDNSCWKMIFHRIDNVVELSNKKYVCLVLTEALLRAEAKIASKLLIQLYKYVINDIFNTDFPVDLIL